MLQTPILLQKLTVFLTHATCHRALSYFDQVRLDAGHLVVGRLHLALVHLRRHAACVTDAFDVTQGDVRHVNAEQEGVRHEQSHPDAGSGHVQLGVAEVQLAL